MISIFMINLWVLSSLFQFQKVKRLFQKYERFCLGCAYPLYSILYDMESEKKIYATFLYFTVSKEDIRKLYIKN